MAACGTKNQVSDCHRSRARTQSVKHEGAPLRCNQYVFCIIASPNNVPQKMPFGIQFDLRGKVKTETRRRRIGSRCKRVLARGASMVVRPRSGTALGLKVGVA